MTEFSQKVAFRLAIIDKSQVFWRGFGSPCCSYNTDLVVIEQSHIKDTTIGEMCVLALTRVLPTAHGKGQCRRKEKNEECVLKAKKRLPVTFIFV